MTNNAPTTAERMQKAIAERAANWAKSGQPLTLTANERELTATETEEFNRASEAFDAASHRIHQLEQSLEQERQIDDFRANLGASTNDRSVQWINTDTGKPAALRANQAFASHPVATRAIGSADDIAAAQFGTLGELVRALTTSSGSAIVPTTWSAGLIDLAREKSAVMQAGATIVPMDSKVVNIGRLTGQPASAFRAENSDITASDPTFDNVTLTAKTQSALVIGSLEWFQDADNADQVVKNAIAGAIAEQIDLAALYGGIVAGAGTIDLATPPNPRGILAALNATKAANVLGGAATNGTAQTAGTFWNEIIDLLFTVRDSNEEPNALIWSSKAGREYAKAVDTTGQPLNLPTDVEAVQRLTSNKIPSYTKGTLTTATDVFAGDFSQLIIGQRLGITLQVLTERYAEKGQIGIVAHWRGDVQPARPGAFAVYKSIKGAA